MFSKNTSYNICFFISKEGNEILSGLKAPRYVEYINILFGNIFKREYFNNDSFITLSDFTDGNNRLTLSGSLNNLYSMVEEELLSQIDSSSFLIDVSDEIKNRTSNDLIKILENWKLFIDYHSKYNSYILISKEDLDGKEVNIYDKRSNDHTEYQLLTNEVRTFFKIFT